MSKARTLDETLTEMIERIPMNQLKLIDDLRLIQGQLKRHGPSYERFLFQRTVHILDLNIPRPTEGITGLEAWQQNVIRVWLGEI